VNAANRFLGVVVGLVLVALAVLGVLVGTGRLTGVERDEPILSASLSERWHDAGNWAIAGTIVAGAIVALLGLWLLISELRRSGGRSMPDLVWRTEISEGTPGAADTEPEPSPSSAGRVRVDTSTLNRVLAKDLQGIPGVDRASVHLTGQRDHTQLQMRLLLASGVDVADLHRHVDSVLRRFAATTGITPEVDDVAVQVGARPTSRVR